MVAATPAWFGDRAGVLLRDLVGRGSLMSKTGSQGIATFLSDMVHCVAAPAEPVQRTIRPRATQITKLHRISRAISVLANMARAGTRLGGATT